MKTRGFVLLWSALLDSSLWDTPAETRLTWITVLLLKDAEGQVRGTPESIARRANLPPDKVKHALKYLESPDPQSHTRTEDGRRLKKVDGGWYVVNHDLYRFSNEAKREFWRQQKAEQRKISEAQKSAHDKEYRKRLRTASQQGAVNGASQAVNDAHEIRDAPPPWKK